MPYQIKTPRLSLAPFIASDLPRQVELANDPAIAKMVSQIPYPYTLDDARNWIQTHHLGREAGTDFPFAICSHDCGLIGAVGLHKKPNGLFDLGYWLGREFWGKGYASEAAKAILLWGEQHMEIKAVTAGFFDDNPASARVLEKSGFLRTGVKATIFSLGRNSNITCVQMIWLGPASQL